MVSVVSHVVSSVTLLMGCIIFALVVFSIIKIIKLLQANILFFIYWLISVISRFIASVTLFLGCIHSSKVLHNILLVNVLRCPTTYFDVTPVGRLLNRFGKDVDIVDEALPLTISSLILMFFSVMF